MLDLGRYSLAQFITYGISRLFGSRNATSKYLISSLTISIDRVLLESHRECVELAGTKPTLGCCPENSRYFTSMFALVHYKLRLREIEHTHTARHKAQP